MYNFIIFKEKENQRIIRNNIIRYYSIKTSLDNQFLDNIFFFKDGKVELEILHLINHKEIWLDNYHGFFIGIKNIDDLLPKYKYRILSSIIENMLSLRPIKLGMFIYEYTFEPWRRLRY